MPRQPFTCGPAGHARLHRVAGHVVGDRLRELLDEHRPLRPRADQAHVAPQHVEQLRQFVEVRRAQDRAEPRLARVVRRRHLRAVRLGIDPHRAELQHHERPAVQPAPLLPVEDRAGARELDEHARSRPSAATSRTSATDARIMSMTRFTTTFRPWCGLSRRPITVMPCSCVVVERHPGHRGQVGDELHVHDRLRRAANTRRASA